ncbi:putative E3 ubiquitin-protein ligase [Neophaeococcomyces mojaviensis]|uniref:E3 ubiquitin-protein ligase n=1 Tax=Neophaeococcomyces mojaviensis TaxID=3383035 RepID=A0ACC3A4W6_9EURO|nr:putative E3 ubiquitin-protein ligase [Knufia sp. JES_112]
MSTRPPIPRGLTNTTPESPQSSQRGQRGQPDLNRPLPAPPSSLPNNYEIPSLQRKPAPEPPHHTQLGHSRSFSHPFPLFFGGKRQEKKAQRQPLDDFDSSDGAGHSKESEAKQKKGQHTVNSKTDKQPVTGKCMTCDSTVRWPQDVKVFRCTTCLTINDLEPSEAQLQHGGPTNGTYRKSLPISLDRTKRLVDTCMDDFFQRMLDQNTSLKLSPSEPESFIVSDEETFDNFDARPSTAGPSGELGPRTRPRFEGRSPSESALSPNFSSRRGPGREGFDSANMTPSNIPSAQSNQSQPRSNPTSNTHWQNTDTEIFRSLESYIAGCLTGCSVLNNSFFTNRSAQHRDDRVPRVKHVRQQPSDTVVTPASEPETFLSELDAKTLLLGDVVENGSWWTGKIDSREDIQTDAPRERSPERFRGIVSSRNPRINWLELAEWYRLILHAGDDWRRRWMTLRSTLTDGRLERWQSIPMETLNQIIMDSQIHLQRSLLKAVENLLKRPRQPLKSPDDCRFLLILLANPLLSPATRKSAARSTSDGAASVMNEPTTSKSPPKAAAPPKRNNSGLGRHSGIIKRIMGLLAYLSNDIHGYLIVWFSRFSDAHFTVLVDLVSSFVTYRLTRQINKPIQKAVDLTEGLVPSFSEGGVRHASQMHAALEGRANPTQKHKQDGKSKLSAYGEDWQIRAAARVMALLFQANTGHNARKRDTHISPEQRLRSAGLNAKHQAHIHGQMIPISNFYNSMLDHADLVADFEAWETTKTKFTFCQYPFFLSIWAKIHILEHDARRQMEARAREAFFDSILSRKAVSQFLVLKVRRDCVVDDSLKSVSEAVGRGGNDIKKGLRIDFVGEEGVDAGGLRKEWFLLLVREIFNPNFGLFVYDEESQYCYFNPFCFESSEQFFLVGILLGLAIYNSTILDVALPPFVFKKMLASAPSTADKLTSTPKISHQYSLEDLAELWPSLARGLRQLLEFEGDVQETFCRDFVIEMERYGGMVQIPLCSGGSKRPVTNANRREFVDMYVHYLLDQSVARQFEPFKRGFFTVCGGNALSLFRPEEIELLIRGSDEPLDVSSLRAVASYDGWPKDVPAQQQPQVVWFWEFFERIAPSEQRKMLSFITSSDRIPAMGATNLVIRLQLLLDTVAEETGAEVQRLPIARTCFNLLGLYRYKERKTLEHKLWTAVTSSEGFGLK